MKNIIRLFVSLTVVLLLSLGCKPESSITPGDETEQEGGGNSQGGDGSDPSAPDGFQEEPDDTSVDKAGIFDYSVLAKEGHPRLLLNSDGFADLKTKVTSGRFKWKTLYKLHLIVIDHANYVLESAPDPKEGEHELIVGHLTSLAYAYRLTSNPAYLTKATQLLNKVCGYGWGSYELGAAETTYAVAIAYDWLYYDLDLTLRKKIHRALVSNGIRPSMNAGYRKDWGNWNQVCNAGVMLAAITLYEKDKAVCYNLLEKSMSDNKTAVEKIYNPDGSYLEGIGYWNYGTSYQCIILQALQTAFGNTGGIADVPGFVKSGEYVAYMHGTMNTSFSYADGGGTTDTQCQGSWWFAANQKRTDLIYHEKTLLDAGKYASDASFPRLLTAVPIFMKDYNVDNETVTPPSAELWYGHGEMPVAMVRRGWKYDSSDIFLGIKGGHCNTWATCNTSHGHMDAGSFVFEAEGVRWSDDIMRPSYSAWFSALTAAGSRSGDTSQTGLRWATFRVNNLCHSTISAYSNDGSVNGKIHPSDYYVDGIATIEEVFDTPDKRGVTLDMTPPLKGQVKSALRTITLEGSTLVVTDRIEALPSLSAPVEWRMLSMASASLDSGCITMSKYNAEGKKVVRELTVISSSVAPTLRTWATARPSDWKDYNVDQTISGRTLVGWSATIPAGQSVTFTTRLSLAI